MRQSKLSDDINAERNERRFLPFHNLRVSRSEQPMTAFQLRGKFPTIHEKELKASHACFRQFRGHSCRSLRAID